MRARKRRAKPFLKWAGGKTKLLGEILPALPVRIATYYEPFLGGGAVFFALANEQRFERAVLGDRNPEVINAYRVVRDHPEALIVQLTYAAVQATDAEYYEAMRTTKPATLTSVERAARFLYLN